MSTNENHLVLHETQLNKPKYDPCRLFKKGDKVRVVEWNGRRYWDYDHHTVLTTGCICEVNEDEKSEQEEGWVSVDYQEQIRYVPPCFLELITPVKEMEPYSVRESDAFDIVRDGKIVMTIPFTEDDYYTFEQAKAAAEAEADRLNAEWRKEQSNENT